MYEVDCPYCNSPVEINHDDGYGFEPDTPHEQECQKCGKVFSYRTELVCSYTVSQAPCLNQETGGHVYKKVTRHSYDPKTDQGLNSTWKRCIHCGRGMRRSPGRLL